MGRVKILIFDLDLTICENSERRRKAIERALNKEISEEFINYIKNGYPLDVILDKMQIHPEQEAILKSCYQHFLYDEDLFQLDRPFGGAVETLTKLAKEGYEIFYLTGRPIKKTAVDFITKYGFPQGDIYAEKVGVGESHIKVKLFQRILTDAKAEPNETVAIGDLPGDALAAKQLGITAIGTYEGHTTGKEGLMEACDAVIKRIIDLPEALRHLNKDVSLILIGRLVSGIGKGKVFIEAYSDVFRTNLGFKPYPGTLNIELNKDLKVEGLSPIEIKGIGKNGCAGALCYPCKIRNVDAVIVRPILDSYPSSKIELIAPFNLKNNLGLKDGDEVEVIIK
jgi:CTP-dependent riboflavin kinase